MKRNAWVAMAMLSMVIGCGNDRGRPHSDDDDDPGAEDRARLCPPAQSTDRIPQRLAAAGGPPMMEYDALAGAIVSACGSCHLAPVNNGNFMFQNSHKGSQIRVNGSLRYVPGLSDVAKEMTGSVVTRTMPPANVRDTAPEYYDQLGRQLQDWRTADAPDSAFEISDGVTENAFQLPKEIGAAVTDLGDCIPAQEVVGHDLEKDAAFAAMTELPKSLTDTDLVSLDAYELAKRGTVGFAVEYPLWADNARKGRWVHTPSTKDAQGNTQRTAVTYDAATKRFVIPDNTRFYKTFYKEVREADGVARYRKIETRLIVVRHAPHEPLFGTYLWDANEQTATLNDAPYRSGEPFKDLVIRYVVDEVTDKRRNYAVPGAHRCTECHEGSESNSFILGFTPIQLNRRELGQGGRLSPIEPDERNQFQRLVDYGVVAGLTPATALKLEDSAGTERPPRNHFELRAQGYATGNCGHCHNPKGFATKQNPTLQLNFNPGGDIFQMGFKPSIYGSGQIVAAGNPATSLLYRRALNPTALEGTIALQHMPAHTPGLDCGGVQTFGQWISSIPISGQLATPAEIAAALIKGVSFRTTCTPPADVDWLEEDFTEPRTYAPRRQDWATAMPASFRALEFTPELQALADTEVAVGFWVPNTNCRFPVLDSPQGGTRPWMFRDGVQTRPWGEIYLDRPGSTFFKTVCSLCHGFDGDGQSGLARTIMSTTGGMTRVANLRDGLFRPDGSARALFQEGARNFAGNYLIWMAMGGTLASFPSSLSELIGEHGANMLYAVRERCTQLLPGYGRAQLREGAQIYETYFRVCTLGNDITPDVEFVPGTTTPVNANAQRAWLDRAAQNAGWMIFRYLRDELATGNRPIPADKCELRYPAR